VTSSRSGFEASLAAFATSFPPGLDGVWRTLSDLPAATAVVLVIGVVIRGRTSVVIDLVVAVASAAALTIAPALIRPLGRVLRWIVGLATFSVIALGAATPAGATAAVLIAVVSAAGAHVVLGSTRLRPSVEAVIADLASLGVSALDLTPSPVQRPGRFLLDAVDEAGAPLVLKVYGRDAVDAQVLRSAWRAMWNRGLPRSGSSGRIQQVQHEASLTFPAAAADVRTHRVVTARVSVSGDALLVLTSPGPLLASSPSAWSDDLAADLWSMVTRLHAAGVTHGRLDDHHLVAEGGLTMTDFHGGALAPAQSDQAHTDLAQTLVTTALGPGIDRSVEIADEQLGHEHLARLLPFVQEPA